MYALFPTHFDIYDRNGDNVWGDSCVMIANLLKLGSGGSEAKVFKTSLMLCKDHFGNAETRALGHHKEKMFTSLSY